MLLLSMVGISLSFFNKKNISTIYSENIDRSLANKITDKIFKTVSSGIGNTITTHRKNSHIIIPLLEDKIVSYVVIFRQTDDDIFMSLSYTVDSDNQLVLYRRIPILEALTKEFIVETENNNIPIAGQIELKEILKNVVETSNDLFLMESLSDDSKETTPLKNLMNKFGKNLSIFYRSVLLNEKIVLVADSKLEGNILNLPWTEFVPHKTLKIIPWPKNPTKELDFDILIIEPYQKKECDLECIKVDIDLGNVEHGKNDKYLESLFDYLHESTSLSIELNIEINNLFNWVHEIIEICTKERDEILDSKIKELIEFHTKTRFGNRLPLITSIAKKYNEYASDKIITYFLKELGIFDDNVKRIDTKKFLSKL